MFKRFLKVNLGFAALFLSLNFASIAHAEFNSTNNSLRTDAKTDQELARKIRDKISSGWFTKGFDKVIVRVSNGDVSLQGTVRTMDEKDKVEVEIRKINGVRSINNQIAVEDLSAPRTSNNGNFKAIPDQELAEKIRDKISSGWFSKGYDEVIVQVNSGNVILLGSVKTRDDKEKVEKEVRKIDGVKHLNNQISVQEQLQH